MKSKTDPLIKWLCEPCGGLMGLTPGPLPVGGSWGGGAGDHTKALFWLHVQTAWSVQEEGGGVEVYPLILKSAPGGKDVGRGLLMLTPGLWAGMALVIDPAKGGRGARCPWWGLEWAATVWAWRRGIWATLVPVTPLARAPVLTGYNIVDKL